MAFNTKQEKYAFVQGLRAGARGKKPFAQGAPRPAPRSYHSRQERSGPGSYRNAGQDEAYWNGFFQESLKRGYSKK